MVAVSFIAHESYLQERTDAFKTQKNLSIDKSHNGSPMIDIDTA